QFLEKFDSKAFSYAPSQMIIAHEVGHELQFAYDTYQPGITSELGADCLAGFFVGWLACNMSLSDQDVMAQFDTMCEGGDDASVPWWSPQAHGSCQQRTDAFARGTRAYAMDVQPLDTCTYSL